MVDPSSIFVKGKKEGRKERKEAGRKAEREGRREKEGAVLSVANFYDSCV